MLTCLLATTIRGRWGSNASSSCRCLLARGKSCWLEESTTNTSRIALDMYFCQYCCSSSSPPTDGQRKHGVVTEFTQKHIFSPLRCGSHVIQSSDSLSRNSILRSSLLMETALKPCVGCTSCSKQPVAQQCSRLVLPAPSRPRTSTCVPADSAGPDCSTHTH